MNIHTSPLDNTWQQTDYYVFRSDDDYWSAASIISLPKPLAATAEEALTYLLQRIYSEAEHATNPEPPSGNKLFDWAIAYGCIDSPTGKTILPGTSTKNVLETIAGILESPGAQLFINKQEVPLSQPITLEGVQKVTAFANQWNEMQYLIETTTAWIYFDWGTMV
jgi:hypothetical protein